jgi:hypothetical protein
MVTITSFSCPAVKPAGTFIVILVGVHAPAATAAAVLPNFTDPMSPKFNPLMVSEVPAAAEVAESAVMQGPTDGQFTAKIAGGLSVPPAVITTFTGPGAILGTVSLMVVGVQFAAATTAAVALPNFTTPGVGPKFAPVIVTTVPGAPKGGERYVIHGTVGGQFTVKVAGALSLPPAETTTAVGPVGMMGTAAIIAEGDQLLIVAVADPNFTPPDP